MDFYNMLELKTAIKQKHGTLTKYAEIKNVPLSTISSKLRHINPFFINQLKNDGILTERPKLITHQEALREALDIAKDQIALYKKLYEDALSKLKEGLNG